MESAGCELLPSWAKGALLLVPLTHEQLSEADDFLPFKNPHNNLLLMPNVKAGDQVGLT